jgi:hypothetical protein
MGRSRQLSFEDLHGFAADLGSAFGHGGGNSSATDVAIDDAELWRQWAAWLVVIE